MKPDGIIVVTRVATAKDGIVPSPEWLALREPLLRRVTAACLRRVTAPLAWVWQADAQRLDQARVMAGRVWPDALVCEYEPDTVPFARCATVRLDSDDAIMPDSLDALLCLDAPPRSLIDWHAGYQFDWPERRVGEWGWPRRRQGPFLAIFHDGEDHLDIGGDHATARTGRPVIHIDGRHWVQTVHGGNIINRWRDEDELPVKDRDAVLERAGVTL